MLCYIKYICLYVFLVFKYLIYLIPIPYLLFQVDASNVDISGTPAGYAIEGNSYELVCESDEGSPTPSVSWSLSDASQLTDLGSNPTSESITRLYRAQLVQSTFQIQPLRQHNDLTITCSLDGSTTVSDDTTLQIKCKCCIITMKCEVKGLNFRVLCLVLSVLQLLLIFKHFLTYSPR